MKKYLVSVSIDIMAETPEIAALEGHAQISKMINSVDESVWVDVEQDAVTNKPGVWVVNTGAGVELDVHTV